ncbi:MAG: molecular chaperone DnaJ, partial [Paramuribaculum sp.]|nr:molecular chaperone DnaJ [Paramuribaculum sp.]
GKGLPAYESRETGDELVNVMVYIPEELTDEERQAFENFRGKPNMQPSESVKKRIFSKLRHIFD